MAQAGIRANATTGSPTSSDLANLDTWIAAVIALLEHRLKIEAWLDQITNQQGGRTNV